LCLHFQALFAADFRLFDPIDLPILDDTRVLCGKGGT
jgi:hypothetical protein